MDYDRQEVSVQHFSTAKLAPKAISVGAFADDIVIIGHPNSLIIFIYRKASFTPTYRWR